PPAAPAASPPATVAPRPDGPARRSPFATTGTASPFGATAASAPPAQAAPSPAPPGATSVAPPLPWASPTTERPASVPPSRPAAGPAQPPAAPERPAASPFDALVASEQPVRARSAAPLDDEDDDEDWDEPEASYTWLHYIVLVVVAFVLGLLVWKLLLQAPDDSNFQTDTDAAAPAAGVSLTYEHPGAAA
ncbi:hypothetical protein ACFQ8Y_11705, partial [Isoptericola sp. NPDC056605]